MWLMVQFDLPVETPAERREYTRFRKRLLGLGFSMHQKSIYLRWDETDAQGTATAKAIRESLPPNGDVAVFILSERAMTSSIFFHDGGRASGPELPSALALF